MFWLEVASCELWLIETHDRSGKKTLWTVLISTITRTVLNYIRGENYMVTFHRFFCIFMVISFTLLVASPALAVKTATWTQQNHKNFASGTLESVAISSNGKVMLAHKLKKIADETEELYIWCLAEDSLGNIYAGTGNKGKIYKVTPNGQFSLFYNSPEVSILSLAIDVQNNIYAGTAPSGLVYKISAGGNTPTTILNADENYVWSLAFDKSGNLYAATGTNGRLYKITPAGKADVLFDSDETNLTSLLFHNDQIYAGSDGKGTIFRIEMDGTVSVIHQTGQKEVRALVAGTDGDIFAGTVTTQSPQPGQGKPRQRPSSPPTPDGKPPEPKKSSIYRITPDDVVSRLWVAPDPLVLSMVMEEDNLIVGTGDSGKVYRVDMDGNFVSLAKCEAGQVIAMHKARSGKLVLATGNAGKIFELADEYEAKGTLTSVSHDTKSVSQWGKIHWEGSLPEGTVMTLATRSGNTEKPDNTWSNWSEELSKPDGSQITSPPARFVQWRSTLSTSVATAAPVLEKARVASVHFNVAPNIEDLKIHIGPPPKERQNNKQGSSPNNKIRSATWKAKDLNDDKLLFAVYYKGINEKNWKLRKKELTDPSYTWDSTSMPNGRYELKVEATDKLSNMENEAISIKKISNPFDIDNTQPVLAEIKSNPTDDSTFQISCVVTDELSPISSASYKIDSAEHWQAMFPEDGILDSHREVLLLETKKREGEEHTITIMVADASGNKSVARGSF